MVFDTCSVMRELVGSRHAKSLASRKSGRGSRPEYLDGTGETHQAHRRAQDQGPRVGNVSAGGKLHSWDQPKLEPWGAERDQKDQRAGSGLLPSPEPNPGGPCL